MILTMDDIGERLAALEATLRTETRALYAKVDQHVQALNGDLGRIRESLRHIDECLDRRMADMKASVDERLKDMHQLMSREMKGEVEFPKRVTWLIVSLALAGLLGGAATYLFRVGAESQRTIHLPTTPHTERSAP